jgi:PAS domain S-box-containing protein
MGGGLNKSGKSPEEQLRIRAEMQIKGKREKASSPTSTADLHKIVHELEVHQIELEMQNEELQAVRANLESLLEQYTDLYDFAPVGYYTLDRNGTILKANLTGANLVGMERSTLINRPFGFFVSPENRRAFKDFLKNVFENRSPQNCELAILNEDDEISFVHIEAIAFDSSPQCRIAAVDVTQQTLAEKKLEESERLFHSLFETMTQGVVFLDPKHRVISINPAGADILGLPVDRIQGTTWPGPDWRLIREDGSVFPNNEQPSQIVFRNDKVVRNEVMGIIYPKSTGCIWLKINALPQNSFKKERPCRAILILEDITHLKRMASYNMLTPREKEVFLLIAKRLGRQSIANILRINPKTVDKHRENLMEKLSIYDMEEIATFARLVGAIKP